MEDNRDTAAERQRRPGAGVPERVETFVSRLAHQNEATRGRAGSPIRGIITRIIFGSGVQHMNSKTQ